MQPSIVFTTPNGASYLSPLHGPAERRTIAESMEDAIIISGNPAIESGTLVIYNENGTGYGPYPCSDYVVDKP